MTGGSVHHGDTPLTHDDPDCRPIVVPLPSLGHRQFCVAGLARGHPDSGEAAIMGVPLPHLVLPLSGCMSKRTPTRATRGEARGHRSVLAQNPLLMHPSFSLFGLVVGMVCPRQMVGWSPFGSRYFGYFPVGCRSMVFICVHVGHRRAHIEIVLYVCVCVLFVHRLAVWVSAGVGHDNAITMSGHRCTTSCRW